MSEWVQYEWQRKTMAIRANAILTSSENHILKNLKKNKMTKKKTHNWKLHQSIKHKPNTIQTRKRLSYCLQYQQGKKEFQRT